jgi:hypothetical protein
MSDTFVPMGPAILSGADHGFKPLPFKPAPSAAGRMAPGATGPGLTAAPAAQPSPAQNCPPPKVTLQRQGDVVSAIRIQCSCGQVIELNCLY